MQDGFNDNVKKHANSFRGGGALTEVSRLSFPSLSVRDMLLILISQLIRRSRVPLLKWKTKRKASLVQTTGLELLKSTSAFSISCRSGLLLVNSYRLTVK